MKRYSFFVTLVSLFFVAGCSNDSRFEKVVPPPPPSEPQIEKTGLLSMDHYDLRESKVDILWVIDNSGSMGPYQSQVISGTNAFIEQFTKSKNIQWHMGLLSTDILNPPYLGFDSVFNWETLNPVPLFQQAVARLGTRGSGSEQTFLPVLANFKKYPDFLRPDAHLALIMVTDESEQSNMYAADFYAELLKLKNGEARRILTYGVFLNSYGGSGDVYGEYMKFVNLTKGVTYNILSSDYGVLLANIGKDLISKVGSLSPLFALNERPLPDTIRVFFEGQELPAGPAQQGGYWVYDPEYNVIRFVNMSLFTVNKRTIRVTYDPMLVKPKGRGSP